MENKSGNNMYGDESKPVSASISQAALDRLHIQYRKLVLASGSLFFCVLQNGLTFDLYEAHSGRIELWRFVGSMPAETKGTRCEYRPLENSHLAIGYEVDEEGNICFYTSRWNDNEESFSKRETEKNIVFFVGCIGLLSVDNQRFG